MIVKDSVCKNSFVRMIYSVRTPGLMDEKKTLNKVIISVPGRSRDGTMMEVKWNDKETKEKMFLLSRI